jgi:ribosomal protein S14
VKRSTHVSESVAAILERTQCRICGKPVKTGSFLVSLPVCGAVAHIVCVAKSEAPDGGSPACQVCGVPDGLEQFQMCARVSEESPHLQPLWRPDSASITTSQ